MSDVQNPLVALLQLRLRHVTPLARSVDDMLTVGYLRVTSTSLLQR